MVDECCTGGCGSVLTIADEAVGAVGKGASLPGVVGCSAADDHIGTFSLEELCRVHEVCVVCLDCLGNTTESMLTARSPTIAYRVTRARDDLLVCGLARCSIVVVDRIAVGSPVIGRGKTATIIVAKLNDNIVP